MIAAHDEAQAPQPTESVDSSAASRNPAPSRLPTLVPGDEAAIDAEIQRKRLTAPRLTPALIDASIKDEAVHVFPGTTLVVCALTLQNGFMVTGESRPSSDANFDEELGRKIARDNARSKIWAFEGYLLRQRLADEAA